VYIALSFSNFVVRGFTVPMSDAEFIQKMARVRRPPSCCYECATPYQRSSYMILCKSCGNKRCPHATSHFAPCTNSNEPGQVGSRYA